MLHHICKFTHLFELDDVSVRDVRPLRVKQGDGGEEEHDVLVGAPPAVERPDEALVLLVQVHAELTRFLQQLHAQLLLLIRRQLSKKKLVKFEKLYPSMFSSYRP